MGVNIGDNVIYADEYGTTHEALVTQQWGKPDDKPSINLLWVVGDPEKMDSYGRQIERNTSVVHKDNQSAHGRWWDFPTE